MDRDEDVDHDGVDHGGKNHDSMACLVEPWADAGTEMVAPSSVFTISWTILKEGPFP